MKFRWLIIPILIAIIMAGCSGNFAPQIDVIEPWARAVLGGQGNSPGENSQQDEMMQINGAAYMVIKNKGSVDDKLLRVDSNVAKAVELHKSQMVDGIMKMEPQDEIVIPAKGEVELKPGSYHIMLIGLNRDLLPGDKLNMKLHFDVSGEVDVEVEVKEP